MMVFGGGAVGTETFMLASVPLLGGQGLTAWVPQLPSGPQKEVKNRLTY